MLKEKIANTIDTLYREVFNAGKYELLDEIVSGPYIQHNPYLPNGIASLQAFLKESGGIAVEVKRIAIDNHLAFIHARFPNWMGAEHAAVDIFRFDGNGKIVEHWDVLQAVPSPGANTNTMF